ncbi:MAG TPA: hypothetical protein VGF45_11550, partial [Polyangia bacterium]
MPGDLTLDIESGALPPGSSVKLVSVPASQLAAPVSSYLTSVGTFRLDLGGKPASGKVGMSLPIPAGVTVRQDDQIFFFAEKQTPRGPMLQLVEIGKVEGQRIKTASWPYCGLGAVAGLLQVSIGQSILATASISTAGSLGTFGGGSLVIDVPGDVQRAADAAGACGEVALPPGRPFSVSALDPKGEVITTAHFGPPDWEGIGEIFVPAPKSEPGPFRILQSFPGRPGVNGQEMVDVPLQASILLEFSDRLRSNFDNEPISVCKQPSRPADLDKNCFCLYRKRDDDYLFCEPGKLIVESVGDPALPRVLKFVPERRLKYASRYVVKLRGIQAGAVGEGALGNSADFAFTTFEPKVLSSASLAQASDAGRPVRPRSITTLAGGRVGIAMGSGEFHDPDRGFAVIDIRDPRAIRYEAKNEWTDLGRAAAV